VYIKIKKNIAKKKECLLYTVHEYIGDKLKPQVIMLKKEKQFEDYLFHLKTTSLENLWAPLPMQRILQE
jgi:hypothetical protein